MPDGIHGTWSEWDRLMAPLLEVQPLWRDFGKKKGLVAGRGLRGHWPCLSLTWTDGLQRKITLYLIDEEDLIYRLAITARLDVGRSRYWRTEAVAEDFQVGKRVSKSRILELLERAFSRLKSWQKSDLRYAGEIAPLP